MNQYNLNTELRRLEGLISQNPETGAKTGNSYISQYTNRIFGAPYQMMDSVDKKFSGVNRYLGTEYLRNNILHAPILHVRPGMPRYTGADDPTSLKRNIQNAYFDTLSGNLSLVDSLLEGLASTTLFSKGAKLQRRMFGFRETYWDYMQHVNYMCRSVAIFLGLTEAENTRFPKGTFFDIDLDSGDNAPQLSPFINANWQNYRMLSKSKPLSPWNYLKQLVGESIGTGFLSLIGNSIDALVNLLNPFRLLDIDLDSGSVSLNTENYHVKTPLDVVKEQWDGTIAGSFQDKITAVEFMVDPAFEITDNLSNETKESVIESATDSLRDKVGSELSFIGNSNVDLGIVDNITEFLGSSVENISMNLTGLLEPVTGGFMTGIISGAFQSIKGQKMIYPKIYDKSNSTTNYSFKIKLTTPYGDIYNYYMNIVVPLMHLIALAAPRMVTANSVASPFLVQAYIPGMCTIQLGIVSKLDISKSTDRVSVNGFPLEVDVNLTIEELYNALAISPANDPASFLFNETLNDYMANMAGLIPSIDTYTKQRKAMFEQLGNYLSSGEIFNDLFSGATEWIEDQVNPFIAR